MEDNVYYNPEKFGLSIVSTLDFGYRYEYDMVVLFKKNNGTYLIGTSSGCSCIEPFENQTIIDLTPVKGWHDISRLVKSSRRFFDSSDAQKYLDWLMKVEPLFEKETE